MKDFLIDFDGKQIKAIIVNEKNYFGNSPVSHEFSYSYQFIVNNKKFRSNSRDSDLNIGDSICVEYSKTYPNFNRVLTDN
ncbi:hypothetical protein BC781_1231 [Sediminitomix flava]|uniref:Uncharacterized protein n=1 Tax=Sediminitomix flava TaxID=379075 RepID=A0A315YU11_SEDFL|nr:hypothetical protein BC781_1231 [Sediminitomix flava]